MTNLGTLVFFRSAHCISLTEDHFQIWKQKCLQSAHLHKLHCTKQSDLNSVGIFVHIMHQAARL